MDIDIIQVIIIGFFGVVVGNWAGDLATLRDCAIRSEAVMMGGDKIKCEVQKAQKAQHE